jgi:hypothetical protein
MDEKKIAPIKKANCHKWLQCYSCQMFVLFSDFFATDAKGRQGGTFLQPTWPAKNSFVRLVRLAWFSKAGGDNALHFRL